MDHSNDFRKFRLNLKVHSAEPIWTIWMEMVHSIWYKKLRSINKFLNLNPTHFPNSWFFNITAIFLCVELRQYIHDRSWDFEKYRQFKKLFLLHMLLYINFKILEVIWKSRENGLFPYELVVPDFFTHEFLSHAKNHMNNGKMTSSPMN